jgi:NADPH:quinone reductase-like Zn-dependent oxidoreductase
MRLYRLPKPTPGSRPVLTEGDVPALARDEVLVRIEAVSINYRDLLIADGKAGATRDGLVPLSDGAGRIHAVGADVTRWKQGDKVAGTFFRHWASGRFETSYLRSALGGGSTDGVLAEFVTFPEHGVVAIPEGLSALEAATLPCAAVTAWQALFARSRITADDTLLVLGTGGVGLFGLQFARVVGARVIVISSSDAKLERARQLGAAAGVNYRHTPEWDKAVIELTEGRGATHILELGGPGTFDRSLKAVAAGGRISQIGVLTGFGPQSNLMRLQSLNADILGITVGSAEHFAAMNAFIAEHRIKPVVDQVFDFENVGEAYGRLRSGEHFGKVVVRY